MLFASGILKQSVMLEVAIPLVTQSDPGTENFRVANAQTVMWHHMDPSINKGWYKATDPLEKELDCWVILHNFTKPHADKNKILPHGSLELIYSSPEVFDSYDFKILVPSTLVNQVKETYTPLDHEVQKLVPKLFSICVAEVYSKIGELFISLKTFWNMYQEMLFKFWQSSETMNDSSNITNLLESFDAAQHITPPDPENPLSSHIIPLLPGLRKLCGGDSIVGDILLSVDLVYIGGLETPLIPSSVLATSEPSQSQQTSRKKRRSAPHSSSTSWCQMHYQEKSKSTATDAASVPLFEGQFASNYSMISKQVAAAQCGGKSLPIFVNCYHCSNTINHSDTHLKVKAVGQPVFRLLKDIGTGVSYPNHVAHSMYEAMCEHFIKLAYKRGGAGTTEISAQLATWNPKKKNGMEFLSEPHIIPNVSSDIDYPITLDEISLCASSWVELRVNPSQPAPFCDQFFDVKGKFRSKKGLHVCLGIPYNKYMAILNHLDNIEEKTAAAAAAANTKTSSLSLSLFSPTVSPPSPPPSTQVSLDPIKEPKSLSLPTPLEHQHEHPETPPCPLRKIAHLSKNNSTSPDADSIRQSVAPFKTDIFFDPKSESHSGSFKVACFGHITPPVFTRTSSTAAHICIKQAFEVADNNHTKHRLYLGEMQTHALKKKIICHIWATSLLNLIYSFMEEFDKLHHMALPFCLPPRMRFVYAALAEVIDEVKKGPFIKYINNNKAKPLILADPEATLHTDFLAFAQHVQYYKLKKMLFVSDFQGIYDLVNY
ncbi:hypothetical protein BDN71DRAFT_1437243 [Pleurotus eryngii]|uniref:Alpha-type protein kinase domain-containing protein n=1 Tax=Pleurotus eryngii TaxID=5323 RepID=A0A9P5ZGX5_PLEER|nr:hypothetical protein BDN71DRAFT_1437243 [Pleurotus eryngii]